MELDYHWQERSAGDGAAVIERAWKEMKSSFERGRIIVEPISWRDGTSAFVKKYRKLDAFSTRRGINPSNGPRLTGRVLTGFDGKGLKTLIYQFMVWVRL